MAQCLNGIVSLHRGFQPKPLFTSKTIALARQNRKISVFLSNGRPVKYPRLDATVACSAAVGELSLPSPDGGEWQLLEGQSFHCWLISCIRVA